MILFVPLFNGSYPTVSQGGHNEDIVQDSSSGGPSPSEKRKGVDSRERELLTDRKCSGTNEGAGESDEVCLISVVLFYNGSHSPVHQGGHEQHLSESFDGHQEGCDPATSMPKVWCFLRPVKAIPFLIQLAQTISIPVTATRTLYDTAPRHASVLDDAMDMMIGSYRPRYHHPPTQSRKATTWMLILIYGAQVTRMWRWLT